VVDRTADVLTFTLDYSSHGNEVTGAMFDARLAELRQEASKPRARVFIISHFDARATSRSAEWVRWSFGICAGVAGVAALAGIARSNRRS
jgi:hypothetical protein